MANVSGVGTVWNCPNYVGELFTASPTKTPFVSMIGGLTGGAQTENFEFPTSSEYAHESLSQKSITETDSQTAPTAITYTRDQSKNVVQIYQEAINVTYVKQSNRGRLSGINSAGAANNVVSEKDWQIARALEKIAREVEWHSLNGTYQISTASNVANQSRGMIELCTVNTVAAAGADLSKALLKELWREMFTNGAIFQNMVIFCGAFQKEAISELYGYAPEDRVIGGLNIKQIMTDYGNIAVADPHHFMPAATLLCAEMSVIDLVFQSVPEKGNLFYEDLAKTGAADNGQIFGQIGLAHGPSFMHGTLTGLSTS